MVEQDSQLGKRKSTILACLHDQNKSGFFPANPSFLKTLQIVLIG